ncbi:MAG: 30S ribosomal protein S24e [Ignisphaera sp.]|nr:30S ribosomal protein S24e [Ignisphaera sp.]MCX8168353.1 30S ribosomal protein S24e [Ignisphaera sp.]MDW8085314.1 30S ribosomal protein S24e [Ignisphaera sp.]
MSLQQKLDHKNKVVRVTDNISITVLDEKYNKLLRRAEVSVYIDHINTGTPSRKELRTFIASIYRVDENNVIVKSIESEYGRGSSRALIYIYENSEYLRLLEPLYTLKRNGFQ